MKACKVLERLDVMRKTLNSYVKSGKIRVRELGNGFYDYDEEDVARLEKDAPRKNMAVIYCDGVRGEFRLTADQARRLLLFAAGLSK